MAQVKTFGGAETLPEGFVAPDPHTYKDALRTATQGRTRRIVAERLRTDLTTSPGSRGSNHPTPGTALLLFALLYVCVCVRALIAFLSSDDIGNQLESASWDTGVFARFGSNNGAVFLL